MAHRYTAEQIDFVRSVAPGRYNDEITELFNQKFGTDVSESRIKCLKANYGIQSNVPKRKPTYDDGLFNKEQIEFIKAHVKGLPNQKLAEMVNEKFNLRITREQMKNWKNNRRLSSGLKGSEGLTPPNKGTKGLYNVGGNKTSFQKGNKPLNYIPVGAERVNTYGYVDVKIADPNKWRSKALILWEKYHGKPVPKGHVVIFGDRDRFNFEPDNLILISRAQLAIMNSRNLIQNDTELTRTGVILADLYSKIRQRKKN